MRQRNGLHAKTRLKRYTPLAKRGKKGTEYEKELNRMRKQVRARDDDRCILCMKPYQEIHHIVPRSAGGTNDLDNLCCLCWECHHTRAHGSNAKEIQKILQTIIKIKK